MPDIFTAQGMHELARLATMPSALAFDLDGTLAPIVPNPLDARVAACTAGLLKALSCVWPVGIITGRSVNDAQERLGFTPRFMYGNHGAERAGQRMSRAWHSTLMPCREHFQSSRAALALRNIVVEDKGLSLALHYPRGLDTDHTRAWLDGWMACIGGIRTSHGHQVMNITPEEAPDKGDALLDIIRDSGAVQAFMIGDDVNDECAFGKAPTGSVTVRVGAGQWPSKARFSLSCQQQINRLLAALLALRS